MHLFLSLQAILNGPFDTTLGTKSEATALAVSNRSLCYFHLNQTEQAIQDVQAALDLGHPDQQKLEKRKASYKKSYEGDKWRRDEPVNPISIPFEVFKTKYSGRGLRALRDIKTGEFLLVDESYACILDVERFDSFCYGCLRKIHHQQMFPCVSCTQVRYCSLSCSLQSWNQGGHSYECKFIELIKERTGNINVSAKMLSLKILFCNDIQDVLKQNHSQDEELDLGTGYETLMKLVDHEKDSDPKNPYTAFMVAFLLERKKEIRAKISSTFDLIKVADRIMKHTRQTKWNAMSVSHRSLTDSDFNPEIKVLREDLIGIGMFFRQLLINHSCDPNIRTAKFSGNKVYLQAIKDISREEEILNSYGMFSKWQSYQERTSYLKENYCFDCECQSCSQQKEPLIRSFLCPDKDTCKGAVVNNVCVSCGRKLSEDEVRHIKSEMIASNQMISFGYKLLSEYLEEGDDDEKKLVMVEKVLTEAYDKLRKVLHPDHRDVIMTLDSICSFYLRTEFKDRSEVAISKALDLLTDTTRVFNEEVHLFNTYIKAIECFRVFSKRDDEQNWKRATSLIKEATSLLLFILPADSQELIHYRLYFDEIRDHFNCEG